MKKEKIKVYLRSIRAISDGKRFRILRLLSRVERKVCVCEVMKVLNMPQHEASKSLKLLKNAGFIDSRKQGRFVFYFLSSNMIPLNTQLVCSIKNLPNEDFEDDEINCIKFCGQECKDCDN